MNGDFLILAYYLFTPILSPEEEVAKHHLFFKERNIRSRIYLSKEGINGQMSGTLRHAQEYMTWLKRDPRFQEVDFKIHPYHEHVFPRKTVKVRSQLVALDSSVDFDKRGTYLSPKQWREKLEKKDRPCLLLDVRNRYEWELGHFEGSELPPLEQFREFPAYARQLKKQQDFNTPIMMYCTGGIRCELYSALLKKEGFKKVFQLQGGVLRYGLEEGDKHWRGRLFVFDDRLSIALGELEAEVISHCIFCNHKSDLYYNCANVDCNELFLSCSTCAERERGCCTQKCQEAPRVRPFIKEERPKPFRTLCRAEGRATFFSSPPSQLSSPV